MRSVSALEGWPSGLRRRPAKALVSGPRGFESHSLRSRLSCDQSRPLLDGWPSGLRRTIGNRVDIVRVGSNPTPSVFFELRCPGDVPMEVVSFEPSRPRSGLRSGFDSELTK